MFRKKANAQPSTSLQDHELAEINLSTSQDTDPTGSLPAYNHNGHKVTTGIHPDGESGRKGFHPGHFLHVVAMSSCKLSMLVNLLWPIVPAAIVTHFVIPDRHIIVFALNYIAMVPAANMIGASGQELARKLPKVIGVVLETTLGSVVEIILFTVLVVRGEHNIPIIRAAILGSILANLLLCLGLCFIAGGYRRHEQKFHEGVSEVGSNLMLVAGMGLIIPAAFATIIGTGGVNADGIAVDPDVASRVLKISRATAIILLFGYVLFVIFQLKTHHSIYLELLEEDEERDADRHRDLRKKKLTLTECIIALVFALACVSLIAVFLVHEIEYVVHEAHVSDAFMGLILVPLVEKAAEHITALDEAYDDQANFALIHVLGASIQTALLNTPLVVLIGWGCGVNMDLEFRSFEAIVLILAIIVVGNFLRDGKSNWLEGALCMLVYVIIAVSAFYYPNPVEATEEASGHGERRRMLMMK